MLKRMGERLDVRRRELGLTTTELARRCEVDKGQVSRFLRGTLSEPNVGMFFTLCEKLDMDPLRAWYGEARRAASEPPPPESGARTSSRPPRK